uniref:Uncharacterized protein n=1 Tax=Romanomermis culicivorax TaxID=13658 RepID=A0A915KVK1_ROMCU
MNKLGVSTTDQEAENIVSKMRVSSQAVVNLETFKNYLILNPSSDPLELAKFWQHSLIVDTGEDTLVPEEFTLSNYQRNTWWKHLLAGGIAGGVSRSFTAPGFKMLVNEGGLRSMWRGNGVNLLKIAPETALKFTFYEKIKTMIKGNRTEDLSILERLLSGSMAGASAQTIIYPMEVLKTRLALRKTHRFNKGIWDAARQIYLKEGAKAFYRGYVPNLCGIAPYAGIDLAVYETLKLLYIKHNKSGKEDPSVFILLACGGFSAVCGQFSSYPLALVKTKLQANVQAKSSMSNQPITMIGQFKYIFKTEGILGFYRGLAPGVVKIVPAVSISYVIYELLRKQLGATMS